MKSWLIDPYDRVIKPVDYDGNWQKIAIIIKAKYFEMHEISKGEDLYVDEEAMLFKQTDPAFYIVLPKLRKTRFIGYGLVVNNRITNRFGISPITSILSFDHG